MSQPCPGRCNRAYRAALDKDTGDSTVAPVYGEPFWCRTCQTHITDALRRLPQLAVDAANMPAGRLAPSGNTDGRHATRTGSPSGSPAWDLADEIMRWVMSWEDALRDHLNEPRQARREWAALYTRTDHKLAAVGPLLRDETTRRRLVDAVAYLANRATALLSWDDANPDAGLEILALARQAEKLTGNDRVIHRLPLPCLNCDRKALRRHDGSEMVKCAACGACWDEAAYQRLAHAYAVGTPRQAAS